MIRPTIAATGTALAAAVLFSLGATVATPTSAATMPAPTALAGTLQSGFATTAPTTLTLVTPHHGTVSVSVSATTQVLRLGGSTSALTELSAGDHLLVRGTAQSSTAFTATTVRDESVQQVTLAGTVTAVNGATVTLTPQRLVSARPVLRLRHALRQRQASQPQTTATTTPTVTFTLSASAAVVLANGTTGTAAAVQTGAQVTVAGVLNRTSHTFLSVSSVHLRS